MSTTETQYFALLRAALWGTPLDLAGPVDWEGVMRIAEHHGNNVLLSDLAFRVDESRQLSPQLRKHMQSEMRGNLFKQMKLKQTLVSAVQLLREHQIEPVLLKGFGLALLYPNPSLRQFGDIDLFVGLKQFQEACALLRGLPGSYNWGDVMDSGKHYNIEFGQHPMEIHRVSADIENERDKVVYAAIEQEGLVEHPRRVDLDGFPVSVPSDDFVVFFTFLHAWEHFMTTGVGWRQLSDVALSLHAYHGRLDLARFRQWLVAMHLMLPWQTFGWLMVAYLGLPEVEMPFYDASCCRRAQRLYVQIMREGNFKRSNSFRISKPKRHLWHKVHAFFGIFADFHFRARVFPTFALREMATTLRQAVAKNGHLKKKVPFVDTEKK